MEKRSIEDIAEDWKAEVGVNRSGKSGFYRMIPFEGKKDLLLSLAQTMIDEGYDEDTLKSVSTKNVVVKCCCPPETAKSRGLRDMQRITAAQWADVLKEFYRGKVSQFKPQERNKNVPAEPEPAAAVDLSVKSFKTKRTGFVETEIDTDFFADLGIAAPDFKDNS